MRELKAHQTGESGYTLDYEKEPSRYRSVDTGLLIALVSLAGTGLATLITGLLNIAAQKHGAYLEISGDTWSVKVPVSMSRVERDRLIEQAKSKDIKKIEIHS